jgi:hypothetical protein
MDTEKYIESLKGEIPKLATNVGESLKDRLFKNATEFVEESKENLIKWTTAVAEGELSKEDFTWLLQSNKDLLKINGLKEIGLTEIQAVEFRNQMFDLVVKQTSTFLENS